MTCVAVVGAQWGDEGKGKVVDLLSEHADIVVRYGGGANAGHTLVIGEAKLVTHLVPSGVLHAGTLCVLADGMVIDPQTLVDEIAAVKARGLLAADELVVSRGAHVIMPYHKLVEGLREERRHAIGTTRRGIGPAYEAKAARRGIRIADLGDRARLRELVDRNLDELCPLIAHLGGTPPGEAEIVAMIDDAARCGDALSRYLDDAGPLVDRAIRAGKNVLLEGAQGALLDIDHGTYPYVTSSATTAAGACQGVGIGPTRVDRVLGITKAYCTRVGAGPFPTEMDPAEGSRWREAGGEFGATTGRPRRCGWIDVPALRRAVRVSGIDALALTKLDIARGRGPIRVCVGYRVGGQIVDELPDIGSRQGAVPVYEEHPGWDEEMRHVRSLEDLPSAARTYIAVLERSIGVPFELVSVGPERTETIILTSTFR
jgi:adenylosuccinate synthase